MIYRFLAILCALAAPATLAEGQGAHPSRAELEAVERGIDQKLQRFAPENPFVLLGLTRGVYLEGYGAVFTVEMNLVQAPGITPFRPSFSREEIARIREAKLQRLPQLRALMRDMLLAGSASLDRVGLDEHIVIAVSVFHHNWEDKAGLPSQVVMLAKRKALLDVQLNRAPAATLETALRVREY